MDKTFLRNFIIFVGVLLACSLILSLRLISNERKIDIRDDWIQHSHTVIIEGQQLSTLVEAMFASQRGYLLTGDPAFSREYTIIKKNASNHIASLSELIQDSPAQGSRVEEMRNYFNMLTVSLENRASRFTRNNSLDLMRNVEVVEGLRDNILKVTAEFLKEEYRILSERIRALDEQRRDYYNTLLISISIGSIILIIFNGTLLGAQRKRSKAELNLELHEERFKLAIDGTQDGIFDWDIKTNKVFFSKQYYKMLGYDREGGEEPFEEFEKLVHPKDLKRVVKNVTLYLDGEKEEFEEDFRMRLRSGRWMWIKSKGKAIFDKNGKPIRMVGTHTDITAMIQKQKKLAKQKEEAEKSSQAKGDFLAHMSHEIRTPLTAISGISEILNKQKDTFNKKQQSLLSTLSTSTSSLKELINDILDFSKIENGGVELEMKIFAIEQIFEETISMMALKANEKHIGFKVDYDDIRGVDVYGDSTRIRQVLMNLVGNAIKFTDQGEVTIVARIEEGDESKDVLRVDVSDTGIGIAEADFDIVFERFKQADSSVSRKYGGTGLGLPISKSLANLMGGEITLESEEGKGSTFTLHLPLKVEAKRNVNAGAQTQLESLDKKIMSCLEEDSKILLVEDYEGNIVILGYLLDDIEVEYDVAKTGKEAIELYKDNDYELVLMDVQMPIMDGFTATKNIREIEAEAGKYTPIIGMTAHALVGDKDKCIDAGMDSYLPKPIVEIDLKLEMFKYLVSNKRSA